MENSKKKKRLTWKQWLPITLLAALTVGTVMYLTYQIVPVTNTFGIGKNTIKIIEPGIDSNAVDWGTDTKPVKLENPDEPDNVPGAVRCMIVPYLADTTTGDRLGGELGTLSEPVSNKMVFGDITLHFVNGWEADWFYQNGFFYYRKVLDPGVQTPQLLTGITLASGKEADYQDIAAKVDVLADILQTEGGAAATEWGISIVGDTVAP